MNLELAKQQIKGKLSTQTEDNILKALDILSNILNEFSSKDIEDLCEIEVSCNSVIGG
jgi:hypothetical protein